jgi:hypothetical protein
VGLAIINRGMVLGLPDGIFSDGILYNPFSEIPDNVTYEYLTARSVHRKLFVYLYKIPYIKLFNIKVGYRTTASGII